MKKLLIVSRLAAPLPIEHLDDVEVIQVRTIDEMKRALDQEHPDAIVLTDALAEGEEWEAALAKITVREMRRTILLRIDNDSKEKEPYMTNAPVFASVLGSLGLDDPESVITKLDELLGK